MEKHHECANMGNEKDSNYDGNCTTRHCLSGMYEISCRWIFVWLSVHNLEGLQSSKLCYGSGNNCQSFTADSQIQSMASPGMICDA